MVVELEAEDRDWGRSLRVSIDDGPTIYFSSFSQEDALRRKNVFKTVYERTDGCAITQDAIPTDVACRGNAAIAAYLFGVHFEGVEDIADMLDVSTSTVEQYISDFRHGRRG